MYTESTRTATIDAPDWRSTRGSGVLRKVVGRAAVQHLGRDPRRCRQSREDQGVRGLRDQEPNEGPGQDPRDPREDESRVPARLRTRSREGKEEGIERAGDGTRDATEDGEDRDPEDVEQRVVAPPPRLGDDRRAGEHDPDTGDGAGDHPPLD